MGGEFTIFMTYPFKSCTLLHAFVQQSCPRKRQKGKGEVGRCRCVLRKLKSPQSHQKPPCASRNREIEIKARVETRRPSVPRFAAGATYIIHLPSLRGQMCIKWQVVLRAPSRIKSPLAHREIERSRLKRESRPAGQASRDLRQVQPI